MVVAVTWAATAQAAAIHDCGLKASVPAPSHDATSVALIIAVIAVLAVAVGVAAYATTAARRQPASAVSGDEPARPPAPRPRQIRRARPPG